MMMKIIVYTIMKDEKHNIDAFLENIKDADGIYILDTGSTDGGYEYITSNEIKSKYPQLVVDQKIYESFDFATARNDNLAMVPNEDIICWTIDLDERFVDGWYQKTMDGYKAYPNFYKFKYWYAGVHTPNGDVASRCLFDKCHRRLGAYWRLPIHEILEYRGYIYSDGYVELDTEEVFVHHYQKESKNREQYINLLKQRIDSNEFDIEAMNHLTTEYMKSGQWQKARDTQLQAYSRGLSCKCDWLDCICGNIAYNLSSDIRYFDDVCMWYERAIRFTPKLRTYYLKYAQYLCYCDKHDATKARDVLIAMNNAETSVQESFKETEGGWSWLPDDTWGVVYCWLSKYDIALDYFNESMQKAIKNEEGQSVLDIINGHIEFTKSKSLEPIGDWDKVNEAIETCNWGMLQIYVDALEKSNDDVDDILSVVYYKLGEFRKALTYGGRAHKKHPDDERISNNLQIFKGEMFKDANSDKDNLVVDYIDSCFNDYSKVRVLDIGCGDGKWQRLLAEYDHEKYAFYGFDAYKPTIESNDLKSKYVEVWNEDVRDYIRTSETNYDLIIMAEVLEHLTIAEAQEVLAWADAHSKQFIVTLPYEYKQDEFNGNEYQIHMQDDLTADIVAKRYPELKLFWNDQWHGYYTKY